MLLTLSLLRVAGVLSATLPMNLTHLSPYSKPTSGNLSLNPLPNPFPIPGTDITLQWAQPQPFPELLTKADAKEAFLKCKTRADTHVRVIGDGPIGGLVPNSLLTVYRSVVVTLFSQTPEVILYSEVPDILKAISWKMSREGYWGCLVRVLRTDGGELLGIVSVRTTIGGDATAT